jgi:hypothetical protein
MKTIYLAAITATAIAQTKIDLRTQSRSVDFGAASSTRPMKTGTTLPAVCAVGDMFFKSDAPAGSNMYGCSATNTWTLQAGGSGVNTASNNGVGGVGVFLQKTGTNLEFKNVNAASGRVAVTNDAANREVDIDLVPANVDLATLGGAISASQIALSSKQGIGSKVQMFGGGSAGANTCAQFDAGGNIVSTGAACGSGGSGSGDTVSAGTGIEITSIGPGAKRVAVDTATVPTFLTAAASLDFGSLAQSTCGELALPLPGAATADSVAPGWPNTLDTGLIGTMFVSAPGNVTVRLCKITGGSVDPANQTFRATVVRGF